MEDLQEIKEEKLKFNKVGRYSEKKKKNFNKKKR